MLVGAGTTTGLACAAAAAAAAVVPPASGVRVIVLVAAGVGWAAAGSVIGVAAGVLASGVRAAAKLNRLLLYASTALVATSSRSTSTIMKLQNQSS